MSWLYLVIASIFEVGWPLGLKIASHSQYRIVWITFAIFAMALSGVFLYLAQKQIPIGTAYAIWTGIGASCTFLIGVYVFGDSLTLMRALGVLFVIAGIICLKL